MDWVIFQSFDNRSLADMLSERLEANDVPTKIDYGAYHPGVDGVSLYVPSHLVHRAKWLCKETALSEEELVFLATGELSGPKDG